MIKWLKRQLRIIVANAQCRAAEEAMYAYRGCNSLTSAILNHNVKAARERLREAEGGK